MRSLAPCFELSNSSFVGDGGQDVPGWTCFVSRLRFVAELAARLKIEGLPGRLLCEDAAAEPQDEGEPSVESEFKSGECAPYCESSNSSNNDACSPGRLSTKPWYTSFCEPRKGEPTGLALSIGCTRHPGKNKTPFNLSNRLSAYWYKFLSART